MSSENTPIPPHSGHPELPVYDTDGGSKLPGAPAQAVKRRGRKFLIRILVIAAVLAAALPVYRGVKAWRAKSLLGDASVAFAVGDSARGIFLLKQALALSPGTPAVQRAVEYYNARSGDRASHDKLLVRMREGGSDPEELMGIAELEASSGRQSVSREALALLPSNLSSALALRRTLLEASLLAREKDPLAAADLCLKPVSGLSGGDAGRLRNQAALFLLSSGDAAQGARAVELLQGVVAQHSSASLAAWRVLARICLMPEGKAPVIPPPAIASLVKVLPSLQGGGVADELVAADLEIKADPASKDGVVKRLTKRFRNAPRADMLDFARWLNGKGCQKEVLAFAGPEKPQSDTDWLLIVLDARSSLGEWKEVPAMLNSPAGFGLPESVRHLFLARAAMVTGDKSGAEDEWRQVGGGLHLEKPETLAYIAGYEEQIGATDRAARTYREMADRKETRVKGLVGLIRCQPRATPASTLIPLYEELLAEAPGNPDAMGDLAYLRLLTGTDVPGSAATAEQLLEKQSNSLARISAAALGRLKSDNPKGALDLYAGKNIDWANAPEPWKAVRCAVLKANGDSSADGMQSSLNLSGLRPEERSLVTSAAPLPSATPRRH
jgi:hypothetical protein